VEKSGKSIGEKPMNKLFALTLVILLAVSVANASIFGIATAETDKTKIDSVFPKLISNTEQCLTNCQAEFTYCLDGTNDISIDFTKSLGNANITFGYMADKVRTEEYNTGKCLKEEKVDCDKLNKDCEGSSDEKNMTICEDSYKKCQEDTPITCIEYETAKRDVPYQIWNEGLPSKEKGCYNVTIYGHKKPFENVDWIPTIKVKGFLWDTEYTKEDWAWWNNSWLNCKNITIYANSGGDMNYTDHTFEGNLTGLNFNSTNEIRIVNNSCSNTGVEVPRDIYTNNTTAVYVYFNFNKTAGTNQTYSVYYNNPTAPAPSYTSVFTTANTSYINVTNKYSAVKTSVIHRSTTAEAMVLWNSTEKLNAVDFWGTMFFDTAYVFNANVWDRTQIFSGNVVYIFSSNLSTRNLTYKFYKNYFDVEVTNTGAKPMAYTPNLQLPCGATIKATENISDAYATYTSADNHLVQSERWVSAYCNASGSTQGIMGKNLNASATNNNRLNFGDGYTPHIQIGSDYNPVTSPFVTGSTARTVIMAKDSAQTGDAQYYIPIQQEYYKFINGVSFTLGAEEIVDSIIFTQQAPANNTNFTNTGNNQSFNFTIGGTMATANCSLLIDNVTNQYNGTTINNTLTNFVVNNLGYAIHSYQINCTNGTVTNSTSLFTFRVNDTLAPTTTATAIRTSSLDNYVWGTVSNESLEITLTCNDSIGIGCNVTRYCFDQTNTCTPNYTYSAPITHMDTGTWYIRYRSNDSLNNTEAINNRTMILNLYAPTVVTSKLNSTTNTSATPLMAWCNATDIDNNSIWYYYNLYLNGVLNTSGFYNVNGTITSISSFETDNDNWTETNFARSNEWASNGSWSEKTDSNSGVNDGNLSKGYSNYGDVYLTVNVSSSTASYYAGTYDDCRNGLISSLEPSLIVYVDGINSYEFPCDNSGCSLSVINVTVSHVNSGSGQIDIKTTTNSGYGYGGLYGSGECKLGTFSSSITAYIDNIKTGGIGLQQGILYNLANFTNVSDGNYTFECLATDGMWNSSALNSTVLQIDSTPPSTALNITHTDDGSPMDFVSGYNYSNRSVDITLTCTDATSGCKNTTYCINVMNTTCNPTTNYTGTITYNSTGFLGLRYRSADNQNNLETINNYSFVMDFLAPDVTNSSVTRASNNTILRGWCRATHDDTYYNTSKMNVWYYYYFYMNGSLNSSGLTTSSYPQNTNVNVANLTGNFPLTDSWVIGCIATDLFHNSTTEYNFRMQNRRTHAYQDNFFVYFDNGITNVTYFSNTTTLTKSFGDLPLGDNVLKYMKTGYNDSYNTTFVAYNLINLIQEVEPAGLQMNVYDELNLSHLTYNVTIANSTSTISFSSQSFGTFYNYTSIPNGNITMDVSANGYDIRTYNGYIDSITFLNQTALLLPTSTGLLRSFTVVDNNYYVISGAMVRVWQLVNSTYVLISSGYTDDSGVKSFFMNPSTTYRVEASFGGVSSGNKTIQPTASSYTIMIPLTLNTGGYSGGVLTKVAYFIFPQSLWIQQSNASSIWFRVTAFDNDMNNFTMTLRDQNNSVIYTSTNSSSAGGLINATVNTTNTSLTQVRGTFIIDRDGFAPYTMTRNYIISRYASATNISLLSAILTFKSIDSTELPDFAKSLIILVVALVIMGTCNAHWRLWSRICWIGYNHYCLSIFMV